MKTNTKKVLSLILSIILAFSVFSVIPVSAADDEATVSPDGNIRVSITTDKDSYTACSVAYFYVDILNTSATETVTNISAEVLFDRMHPVGRFGTRTAIHIDELEPHESKTFVFRAMVDKNVLPMSFLQRLLHTIINAVVGKFTVTDSGFNDGRSYFDTDETVNFAGVDLTQTVRVYHGYFDNTTVTREAWIAQLVEAMGVNVKEYTSYSFDDAVYADSCNEIETAVERGWIDLETDEDNIVYFYPDAVATKEFVAYTAARALLYDYSEYGDPSWEDADEVTYSAEAQQAVDAGLVDLVGNSFDPADVMSSTEAEAVLERVGEILASDDGTSVSTGGTVIASSGVSLVSGSSLFDDLSFAVDSGDVTGSVALKLDSIDYLIDGTAEAYLAFNGNAVLDLEYSEDFGSEATVDESISIATFTCPLGGGLTATGEILVEVQADGSFDIAYSFGSKAGIHYVEDEGIRAVENIEAVLDADKLEGDATVALNIKADVSSSSADVMSADIHIGGDANTVLINSSTDPLYYCLDAENYLYLTVNGEVTGVEDIEKEVFNYEHTILRIKTHFEQTGEEPECNRGFGDYAGSVVRADNTLIPVPGAKIQVYRGDILVDTVYTDDDGEFRGRELPAGTYTIRISCTNYIPYEREVDIIGGETTVFETQLIISRDDPVIIEPDYRTTCSGYITDAFTGYAVPGATVEIELQNLWYTVDVASTTTDSNGYYSFEVPAGQYLVRASKDGYTPNSTSVTVRSVTENVNIVLNPIAEEPELIGDLRVVLRWGLHPYDLDSHMLGPSGSDRFHVAYYNKVSPGSKVDLDVDDTTSYGPETTTVYSSEPGIYSFYVHDYTNRHAYSSRAMANSGATVQIYDGTVLKYTIAIPSNSEGTVWHVFNYNSETGVITLVNDFGYQSSPSSVGS